MPTLTKPALDPRTVASQTTSGYPEPYRSRVVPRDRRRLGDELGLTKIGVNLTTLAPGKESSMRHWHTHEDEFIYIVAGEVMLRTDAGEQALSAGMCAGFAAGDANGHQLINRSGAPAVYIEISNRVQPGDTTHYSDADVDLVWNGPLAPGRYARRDGSAF
jgi:uncharacterized cupin superfamily protein